MSKWDRVRGSFGRAHDDLFHDRYVVTFFGYTNGTYDSGEQTGRERQEIGTATVEIVPPNADTTIDRSGTDLSFSTSIRMKDDETLINSLDFPGDGVEKPGEAEVTDTVAGENEVYQLHAYEEERGSGFVMVRLEEL